MNNGKCSVADCDNDARTRGFCGMHYKRFMKHGDPLVTAYSKRPAGLKCNVSGCSTTVLARGMCGGHYQRWRSGAPVDGPLRPRNSPTPSGKVCPCCGENKPISGFSTQDGGRVASWCKVCRRYANKRRQYGLNRESYDAMISGGCTVCGSTERVHIDHCHRTGRVRGALCSPCNVAIGYAKDDPERLEALAEYLRRDN